jgi:hypothetical protein
MSKFDNVILRSVVNNFSKHFLSRNWFTLMLSQLTDSVLGIALRFRTQEYHSYRLKI